MVVVYIGLAFRVVVVGRVAVVPCHVVSVGARLAGTGRVPLWSA